MTSPASLPLPLAYDPQSFDAFNAAFEDADLLPPPADADEGNVLIDLFYS